MGQAEAIREVSWSSAGSMARASDTAAQVMSAFLSMEGSMKMGASVNWAPLFGVLT